MPNKQLLLSSLSQDLFRIANFVQTGATKSAWRFWQETRRWLAELQQENMPSYLRRIMTELETMNFDPSNLSQAERILTYGVITQSLAYHGT
jgi:hypothetical protein